MIKNLSKILEKKTLIFESFKNRKNRFKFIRKNIKIIGTSLFLFHLINIYKKTDLEFIGKKNEKNKKIINSIKSLNQAYLQTPYFISTCFEIIYGNIDKRETVKYNRKIIYTKKGEQIAIDFCDSEIIKKNQLENSNKKPVVLLIPGLCGHSNSPYIR